MARKKIGIGQKNLVPRPIDGLKIGAFYCLAIAQVVAKQQRGAHARLKIRRILQLIPKALPGPVPKAIIEGRPRSEEHTSELQSLMRLSSAVLCLKKKIQHNTKTT